MMEQIKCSYGVFNPEEYFKRSNGDDGEELFDEYLSIKDKLESPLEHIAFCRLLSLSYTPFPRNRLFNIIPQFEIKTFSKNYRVDFLIQPYPQIFTLIDSNQEHQRAQNKLSFCIEIDGFKYHNDKEKFSTEKQRLRTLQLKGQDVVVFSGKEIWEMGFGLHCFEDDILSKCDEKLLNSLIK